MSALPEPRFADPAGSALNRSLDRKRLLHVLLPLFIGSVIAYLDRVNLAYAALTMNEDLGFSASVFGLGAGIFFAGYVLFEIPGALIAERWSARIWLARIMVSWGAVSYLMAFVRSEWQFYVIRFLLGTAEASYVPVGGGGGRSDWPDQFLRERRRLPRPLLHRRPEGDNGLGRSRVCGAREFVAGGGIPDADVAEAA